MGLRKNKRTIVLTVIAVVTALLSACTGAREKNAFSVNIKEEDKLILYTSHKEEVYGPIVKEFEERTGIWVDVYAGGTTQVLDKLRIENGQNTCDVMFGGGVESYEAYKECFEPYVSNRAEQLDTRYISKENLWTPFTELPIVFIYNNKLVSQEDAPRSWQEFLNGHWKGKIAFADPGNSGTSYTALTTLIQIVDGNEEDIVKEFVENLDGNVSAGSAAVMEEVKSGVRLVGITLEETAQKEIAAGADLSMTYPMEGTSAVPDGCALVKGAPHEENAKLFIDFVVGDDVQKIAMEQFCRRSVRLDMEYAPEPVPAAGELVIADFDLEWAGKSQEEILHLWNTLLDQEGGL